MGFFFVLPVLKSKSPLSLTDTTPSKEKKKKDVDCIEISMVSSIINTGKKPPFLYFFPTSPQVLGEDVRASVVKLEFSDAKPLPGTEAWQADGV